MYIYHIHMYMPALTEKWMFYMRTCIVFLNTLNIQYHQNSHRSSCSSLSIVAKRHSRTLMQLVKINGMLFSLCGDN